MTRVATRRTLLALVLVLCQCTLALHDGHHPLGLRDCAACTAHSVQLTATLPPELTPVATAVVTRLGWTPPALDPRRPVPPAFRSRAPPRLA